MLFYNFADVFQISAQISQLLFYGLADRFSALFPALGETVVLVACFLTVGSGLLSIAHSAAVQNIDDFLRTQPCLVQKGSICGKTNVLRHTGGVQNQSALVLFGIFRAAMWSSPSSLSFSLALDSSGRPVTRSFTQIISSGDTRLRKREMLLASNGHS